MPQAIISKETKYFDVGRCTATNDHDQLQFIQIKLLHGFHHIYRPYSTFHLHNYSLLCPNTVFVWLTALCNSQDISGSPLYHKNQLELAAKIKFFRLEEKSSYFGKYVGYYKQLKTLKLDHPTAIFIIFTILVVISEIIL